MRRHVLTTVFILSSWLPGIAQDTPGDSDVSAAQTAVPTVSLLIARTGLRTDAPHASTYHFVEFLQARGRWIYPDIGYIDFGHGNYREFFAGAGHTFWSGKWATLVEELYFDQATGPASKSARYVQPWTLIDCRFSSKLTSEVVYFPYLPLNRSARIQHVLERAKVEYALTQGWKIGAGYAGYKYGDYQWQNRPLLTTTVSIRAGSFEFWLQKLPGGGQVQMRYQLLRIARR